MPVYNGEKYLQKALESILRQTFKDFELIVIDDGSTDSTEEIIKSYKDQRIVYIKNSSNKGLSISFNIGIRVARGRFIARMDADDISTVDRFEKQVTFLEKYENIDIVGSSVILIDKDGKKLKKIGRPTIHANIKWQSLFSTPMFHPTTMARAETLKNNPYDENLGNSEDYELWSRLLFNTNIHFANISTALLFYRVFDNSFTQKLDNGKKIASAQNTISNLEHYISLSNIEKWLVTALRQNESLSIAQLWNIWKLYLRAAASFCSKEKISFPKNLAIRYKLVPLMFFLLKHKIKHLR